MKRIFIYMNFFMQKYFFIELESSLLVKWFNDWFVITWENLDSKHFYKNLDPYQMHPWYEIMYNIQAFVCESKHPFFMQINVSDR